MQKDAQNKYFLFGIFCILFTFVFVSVSVFAQSDSQKEYLYDVRIVYADYMGQRTISVSALDEIKAEEKARAEFERQRPGQTINFVSVKYIGEATPDITTKPKEPEWEVNIIFGNYMGQRRITVFAQSEEEALQKGVVEFERQRPNHGEINSVRARLVN